VRIEGAQDPVDFGDKMALVGQVVQATAAPGSNLTIKLYWRALAVMDEDYTVFVHLLDASGQIVAHKDDQPEGGKYPTSFWDVGETVADGYIVALPADLAAGDYRLEIGVYRAGDGARLQVRNGGDAITLETLRVVP
jgi:hypothetical protein